MFYCSKEQCNFKIFAESVMQRHVVEEHGVSFANKYREVLIPNPPMGINKRGQTKCKQCYTVYNNRSRPLSMVCKCGHSLVEKPKPALSAFHLTGPYYSVRKHKAGLHKRVIVNKEQRICYAENCLQSRAHYSAVLKFDCEHLSACVDKISPIVVKLDISEVSKYIKSEVHLEELNKEADKNNKLCVYQLPEDNIFILNVFQPTSHECPSGYIHISMNKPKCPLRRCSTKPHYHYHVKTEFMCLHVLLCKLIANELQVPIKVAVTSVTTRPQFSQIKTTENIISKIQANIPSPLQVESENIFLQKSLGTQNEVFNSRDLSKYEVVCCETCKAANILRKKKMGNSFIVTPAYMFEISINTYICKNCEVLYLPNMFSCGFVPVSDNLIVSWSYIIDSRNQIKNGCKLYNYFKSSLRRLALENSDLSRKIDKIDFHNLCVRLSKCSVSYNTACLLNSSGDRDSLTQALCLHCGLIPITLQSDGNAKNSVFINRGSDNLSFDKSDDTEIMTLDNFLRICTINVTGSSLFQNFQKIKINVFKIPPFIANLLSNNPLNRESLKNSIFLQDFDLSVVDFREVTKIVTSGEFNLLKSRTLSLKTLRKLAKRIKIPNHGKHSKVMIENIILDLFSMIVGGQGNCHHYSHSIGETGGWTDFWCPHNVKYASKKMILQESVLDPADIFLSLNWPPVLSILDDACTFIAHLFCSQQELSDKLFGKQRGCFEEPHKTRKPKTDFDCPELLPLSLNPRKACKIAVNNPDSKVHPLSKSVNRKVLGTKHSQSHKTQNECGFHSVLNCKQSSFIKTMSQEGHQMRRKCKRVTSGKRQSLECHMLFNLLLGIVS